ncbi:hypothetical protein N7G274_007146 [Stereocaulon virgatum]|uniref:BZIP domain-containing protein n=1 Tax=Stereocaulon virgatum TaxID=373712 RepID=A0ABR4A3J7_9LECA
MLAQPKYPTTSPLILDPHVCLTASLTSIYSTISGLPYFLCSSLSIHHARVHLCIPHAVRKHCNSLLVYISLFRSNEPDDPVITLFSNAGTSFVPITAAVEVLSPSQSAVPFRGPPYSLAEVEENYPELISRPYSQSRPSLPYRHTYQDSKVNNYQCHAGQENRIPQDKAYMSQGPAASRPSSSYQHDDRSKRLPPLDPRALPPIQSSKLSSASQEAVSNPSPTPNASARPPPQSSTPPDLRSSRPIGVQNLLNPTTSGDAAKLQNRRRNGDHLGSPGSASYSAAPPSATPPLPAPSMISSNVSLPSITPPLRSVYPQPLGHLTPRSPSIYTPSPITMGNPIATMDVKQSPFVQSREHTGMGGPPNHSLPEMARVTSISSDTYGSSLPPRQSPSGRRESLDSSSHGYSRSQVHLERTGGTITGTYPAASMSDSPSTQYSSYSQLSRTPPATAPPSLTGQPQSFFTTPFTAAGPASMPQMKFDTPSSSSAGTGSYQIMTLDTENGPIQVPVDVQAASKVADEKRKRNATASHRFRQRRKEKERETSQNIAKLEQQIREMEEEREHYRRERDYFREIATRNPGHAHLLSRPISPRQRRHASFGGAMGLGNVQYQSSESGNRNGSRNTRRRTSTYVPPTGAAPQAPEPPQQPLPLFERSLTGMSEHSQVGNRGRL